MDCCSPGDSAFDCQFDARHAAGKLRAYRRKGPVGLTRALIEALAAGGIDGQTVLDIGGGVGAVHHELLRSGAATAVDVDASRAYIAVARLHDSAARSLEVTLRGRMGDSLGGSWPDCRSRAGPCSGSTRRGNTILT